MSDEMAVGDNASNEDSKVETNEVESDDTVQEGSSAASVGVSTQGSAENEESAEDAMENSEVKEDERKVTDKMAEDIVEEDQRGIKRRASTAFSDENDAEFRGFEQPDSSDLTEFTKIVEEEWKFLRRYSTDEDFKGFERVETQSLAGYNQILERLEAEVSEAVKNFTPLRHISSSLAPTRASKRPRQDTDGSRPSSALSSRSDGDGAVSTDASSSPAGRGRRPTTEMSSPLLRVPLEKGWKRELVYRAALDQHSRRNADIYYYSPQGKKLRSTREVAEHLSGTGLTLEHFSFFKEPLGIDDPEKEIIRDAKLMRRVDSPVAAPVPVEGKRTPKPKPPKGASPEPSTPKSPPAKIKDNSQVKSMGSRLNNNSAPTAPSVTKQPRRQSAQPQPAPAADNNNTAAWRKHRTAPPLPHARPHHAAPPLQVPRGVQPCSMSCGRAVPSLACAACLCLYHPACLGLAAAPPHPFYCKNCETSPPRDPPPLTHKPVAPLASAANAPASAPAHAPANPPVDTVPVPRRVLVTNKQKGDKRVLLRMKMSGGADGQKVWAVSPSAAGQIAPNQQHTPSVNNTTPTAVNTPTPTIPQKQNLPQSLAVINGRKFIVVARGQQN